MPYCFYCGDYVKNKVCVRCYSTQPGANRKEEIKGNCGFSERLITIGAVILFLYLASGFIFDTLNFIFGLLNK